MIQLATTLLHTLLVLSSAGAPAGAEPALAPAAAAADQTTATSAAQPEDGVLFVNRSRETQFVLATFDGEQCDEMEDRAQLELAPGESETVDSGTSRVCWCASTLGKVGGCTSWSKAKPGKRVVLR